MNPLAVVCGRFSLPSSEEELLGNSLEGVVLPSKKNISVSLLKTFFGIDNLDCLSWGWGTKVFVIAISPL